MSEATVIRPGLILAIDDEKYRILGAEHGVVSLCMMGVNKLELRWIQDTDIDNGIVNGNWRLTEEPPLQVIDINQLPDAAAEKFQRYRAMVYDVRSHYGPLYVHMKFDRKDLYIKTLMAEYGVSNVVLWKLVRRWLQSGYDDMTLIDMRATRYLNDHYAYSNGKITKTHDLSRQRLSDTDIKNMSKYVNALLRNQFTNVRNAYLDMLNKHYRERVTDSDGVVTFKEIKDCPSYQQFLRFYKSRTTQQERDAAVMKARELRNNKRLLLSSSMTGVTYPGQTVEVDEVDDPVSLVSELDSTLTVGRPNTYLMIDVKTRVILAMGVAYNQNAYIGLSNMLINLAEDKVEYCKKYGITIKPEEWPSGIIPAVIRTDRGADFKGNDFRNVCMKVGIERNLEPPATGSMKGIIENSFKNIQRDEKELFKNVGLITKSYDSNHHQQAMLNLYEYTKVLILLIIKHNKRQMSKYPASKELLDNGIKPIPYVLWQYYSNTVQKPMPIANKEAFLVTLMIDGKASIDKQGIHFLKRTYLPDKTEADLFHQMYVQQSKKAHITIKYDPRIMNNIYYVHNGRLIILTMAASKPENNGYFNMSAQEIINYNKMYNAMRREGEIYNRQLDADTLLLGQDAVSASYKETKPSGKNIRENRVAEKSNAAQENYSISDKLHLNSDAEQTSQVPDSAQNAPELTESELNAPAPDMTDDDMDDADLMEAFRRMQGK